MCGIFGIIPNKGQSTRGAQLLLNLSRLFILSQSRGKEASGFAMLSDQRITVYKQPIPGNNLVGRPFYRDMIGRAEKIQAVIGHARLVTNGTQARNVNNQPVVVEGALGVHNGIIVNDDALWQQFPRLTRRTLVDTEILLQLISTFIDKGESITSALCKVYGLIEGSATIAAFLTHTSYVILATNTGSLYHTSLSEPPALVFASERYILSELLKKNRNRNKPSITHVRAGHGIALDITTGTRIPISFNGKSRYETRVPVRRSIPVRDVSQDDHEAQGQMITLLRGPKNSIAKLSKHVPDYRSIAKIPRCRRCIMPETIPFAGLDANGVCRFCRDHQKIRYRGIEALQHFVAPYRNRNGKPDCILAFSGGRDSSYGLHFVKNTLGMNPIAYTYDWGMVTDLARRNQARLVGKLGIEHVIVSADIKMKREHIRKHILAWIKKPDLGMVPLFMAGDKQAEYYVEELKQKTGIKLVIYCRGNELEDEKFKFGHCGIYRGTPKGVTHFMSLRDKLQLARYYGTRYLSNPSYINLTIVDTLFAYFSTYIMPHDFVYLWHYIPWAEETIVSTLKSEYKWETSKETSTTWRTDDGFTAFYNYIYLVMQGANEHDGFRSNQIREGVLTRDQALKLVSEERKPQYEALAWYFDAVGLDGDTVLSAVDAAPKLYATE